ncbi:hypothetical protein HMPREF3191_00089 [Veillonellaceae bacterium DNF00626]|nr:hypothetical protein HMPREF3191_00089 [Veillonellaceae bacterium DNF00626]
MEFFYFSILTIYTPHTNQDGKGNFTRDYFILAYGQKGVKNNA